MYTVDINNKLFSATVVGTMVAWWVMTGGLLVDFPVEAFLCRVQTFSFCLRWFFQVLQFPPTLRKHVDKLNLYSKFTVE